MTSLTRYEGDGLEFYINKIGEVFATQAGISRMCDVSHTAIQHWASRNQIESNKSQVPTPVGIGSRKKIVKRAVSLYDENSITLALAQFNPERLRIWAQIGIRAMAHKLTGWVSPITIDDIKINILDWESRRSWVYVYVSAPKLNFFLKGWFHLFCEDGEHMLCDFGFTPEMIGSNTMEQMQLITKSVVELVAPMYLQIPVPSPGKTCIVRDLYLTLDKKQVTNRVWETEYQSGKYLFSIF